MSDARDLVAALAAARLARRPRRCSTIPPGVTGARLALAVLALLAVVAPAAAEPKPETFAVRLDDANGHVCSGFHIDGAGDRFVGFAGHCVVKTTVGPPAEEGGPITVTRTARLQYSIRLDNGPTLTGDLVGYSDPAFGGEDWAVLRVRGDLPADWPGADLDCTGADLPMGTRLLSIGYPARNYPDSPTLTEGFVNGRTRHGEGSTWSWPLIYVTLPDATGASGSAVQRASDGKTVGILVAVNDTQGAWSYAQPIAPICSALHK